MNLLQELPNPQRRAIDLIRELAIEKDCRPYLVGGPVRDLLLGRQSVDIDLTLEEDASTLARALARRLNGRVRSFPQFLTYKVSVAEFPEIDLATARKERYRKPGALPAVTAGRLKDDLLRRDFSINAIALGILDGRMHDPTGGAGDIEARVLRVLHDRSFIDDPTRIFRAIRLATRLGFTMDPHTASLMTEAVRSGALSTVSKERIWRELFLGMDEEHAPEVLEAFSAHGTLEELFGRKHDRTLRERLETVRAELATHGEIDRYVVYTGTLLRGDASPIDFEGSGFSQKRARMVVEIANELPRVLESLAAARDDRERFRICRSASAEMRVAIVAERPSERALLQRFREYEQFRLPLRGNDLEVPGGPHVAKALERTREAVFSGEIPADQARTFARAVARRLLEEESQSVSLAGS